MTKRSQAGPAVQRLEHRHRQLTAAVDGLERLSAQQLDLVLRQTGRSLDERGIARRLLLILAGPGLRIKVVDRLLNSAACDEDRSVFYRAALGTLGPEPVRAGMPALIDGVISGKVTPDYAHLLPMLWAYEDYPQLTRLIRYMRSEASAYDKQTLVDFLEDYEPDDLLDRIQPWWKERPLPSRVDDDDGGSAQAQEPDPEARQAWTAFTTALAQRDADAKEALKLGWTLLLEVARELPEDEPLAHLVLLPRARRHLGAMLQQLGAEVETRILPILFETIGVDVTLTAQGAIQDDLARAGFVEAAQRVREIERERIGVYDEGHYFAGPRTNSS